MDRALNPKDEKQTIYEIYRACRLCGAGAGYKMPIIQNVVDLEGDGVELRQKIKECVQIEVNHTDRMPPLICELCVDKVNEFHDFLTMCNQSNRRTRLRLGLPLQTPTQDSVDSENCILGVTEPVFNDSDAEAHAKNKNKKSKVKKEPVEVKIKIENSRPSPKPEPKPAPKPAPQPAPQPERAAARESRESRESSEEARWTVISRGRRTATSPTPTPKRTTRQNADASVASQIEVSLAVLKSGMKRTREKEVKIDTPPPSKRAKTIPEPVEVHKPGPRSSKNVQHSPKEIPVPKLILKSQITKPAAKNERKPSPAPQPPPKTTSKALPSKVLPSKATPSKALPSKATPSKALPSKATPSKVTPPKALPSKAPDVPKTLCQVCKQQMKTGQGLAIHYALKHLPTFTSPRHACNACELWFNTIEEANNHHKNHKNQNEPYKCTRCYGYFKLQQAYEDHFGNALCLSVYEVPDVKCWECWLTFPTNRLLEQHQCQGEDGRAGGKCKKCNRNYALLKNLEKHESTCTYKKKGEVRVEDAVRARLLPMQVRVARCDPLLATAVRGHVHSYNVPHTYGLDPKYLYPYLSPIKVKSELNTEPTPHMVSIDEEIKEEFSKSFVHWDSDSDVSDCASVDTEGSQKKVNTLSTISLKTIFSKNCMGKVPKRLKSKTEAFESFNDFGMGKKIDNIIDNLSNDDAQTSCSYDSDSILENNLAKDDGKPKDGTGKGDNDSKNVGNSSPTILNDDSQTMCDSNTILEKNMKIASKKLEDDKVSDTDDTVNKVPEKQNDTSEQENTSEIRDEALEKVKEKSEATKISDDSDRVSKKHNESEKDESMNKKEEPKSLEENDVPKDNKMPETDVYDDVKLTCNTEHSNNADSIQVDDGMTQSDENQSEVANENILINKLEDSQNADDVTNEKDLKNDNVDSTNQFSRDIECLNKDSNNQFLSNIKCLNENKLTNNHSDKNYFEKMDVDEQNDAVIENETKQDAIQENNVKDSEKPTESNEIFSKIDEITSKILKENETSPVIDDKCSTQTNDDIHQKSDPYSDSISLNSIGNEIATNNQDKFNVNDLNEDDQKLMAEIDAQIGENDQKISENNKKIDENNQDLDENIQKSNENHQKSNEKVQKSNDDQRTKDFLIDNLLKKHDTDLRSLDLDSISDDEFNFDI